MIFFLTSSKLLLRIILFYNLSFWKTILHIMQIVASNNVFAKCCSGQFFASSCFTREARVKVVRLVRVFRVVKVVKVVLVARAI